MAQILERTVLFADLRGSTSLYETLGNSDATTVVTHSVSMLADVVGRCQGVVVKTLGDGLMAVFADARDGVAAADEMHDTIQHSATDGGWPTGFRRHLPLLRLQVALAQGEVVEMAGDCFGDAVNVAARLLDHAGDNETLVTHSVLAALEEADRQRFRTLDRLQLRGRVEPVLVHLLAGRRTQSDAVVTAYGDITPSYEPEGIRLVWQNLNRIYAGPSLPIVLGRSPQAAYCIDDSRVSRSHARIDWHGGTFQLTDLSYNGSYVRFLNDPEVLVLRRGTCTLHGVGLIGLGAPPTDESVPVVRFEVMKFSDTQPQFTDDDL
jgi:adenylate cyclase